MECRSSRKGFKSDDNCKPFGYDAKGWPLGMACAGDCGGWLCSHKGHSVAVIKNGKTTYYCRNCKKAGKIPH